MANNRYSSPAKAADEAELPLFERTDGTRQPDQPKKPEQNKWFNRNRLIRWIVGLLLAIIVVNVTVTATTHFAGSNTHHRPALTLQELRNGSYASLSRPIEWLPNGKNGEFVQRASEGFAISRWENRTDPKTVAPNSFKDADGRERFIEGFLLNDAHTHAILVTDKKKHWRHSSFSRYWIFDISTKNLTALHSSPLSYVAWNPDGKQIAYVLENDIYNYNIADGSVHRVTHDGGADVFNGIPDWVYEEEVFAGDSALWWSPKGDFLAYVRTNDSLVPTFPIPYFLENSLNKDGSAKEEPYPELVELKYPKPGFPNPLVELWIYDSKSGQTKPAKLPTKLEDPIISEVIWVGDEVVAKLMNREADYMEVWVITPREDKVTKSREYSSNELGGSWFEVTHNSHAVGTDGYIDTVDNEGYNHLAYFSPANSSHPKYLTKGQWEVQDSVVAVNQATRHVYFHASIVSSEDISLYRVSLDNAEEPEPVAYEGEGVHSAVFSPDASFATVWYTSPVAPQIQKVVKLSETASSSSSTDSDNTSNKTEWRIEENKDLHKLLESRNILKPENVIYSSVKLPNGETVNYREIRPTSFNSKKKHPLLFFNYGGPGSQQVLKRLSLDFQRIFAETHNAVVVTVDPRGTANRGRKFRASVRDHLGENEADDVIAVAKIWNEKEYIDSETTAIWGWSYGGFLTLKTLERDTDLAFKYGVAVAPVTDWALYDSIYTERYMHRPQNNADGYKAASIHNVTNIGRHNRFLIMHGTGDDNVHFQNSLRLFDQINLAGIENYDVHVFPDSDHAIAFHNANAVVYDKIDQWLSQQQGHHSH